MPDSYIWTVIIIINCRRTAKKLLQYNTTKGTSDMIEQVAWNKSSLLLKIIFKMHTHYNYFLNINYLQKLLKMPSRQAWVESSVKSVNN
jgi:hypothetical protein